MSSPSQEQSRSARLREYQAELDAAARVVAVLGAVVRGREVRGWLESEPPEVRFAASAPDGAPGLPAAVWVVPDLSSPARTVVPSTPLQLPVAVCAPPSKVTV